MSSTAAWYMSVTMEIIVDDDGGDAIDTVGILIMLMVLVMKMMMV